MKKSLVLIFVFALFIVNYSCKQKAIVDQSAIRWFKAGLTPAQYEMGGNPFSNSEEESGFVKSNIDNPEGFGTWMTQLKPEKLLGNRIKLTVSLKTENVQEWASMWMRVDGSENQSLSFDNMQDRPLMGDQNWDKYEIVLDVPQNSVNVAFGLMLAGKGKIWAKDLDFKIVDDNVAVTNLGIDSLSNYLISGNYEKAIPFIEKLVKSKNVEPYFHLYYYVALLETNNSKLANQYLSEHVDMLQVDENAWLAKIVQYLYGNLTEEELLNASANSDKKIENGQKCEAYFYIGIRNKFNNNLELAKEYFQKAIATNETEYYEYGMSQAELNNQ